MIKALIARFLPSLLPGLGALLNPWILIALGSALVGAFLYGLHIGNSRLEAFESAVAAEGKAALRIREAQIKVNKSITERSEREHQLEIANLNTRVDTLSERLRVNSSRRYVPTLPKAPGGSGAASAAVCYNREALNAGLQRIVGSFLERTAGTVAAGDKARVDFHACAKWILEQREASKLSTAPAE